MHSRNSLKLKGKKPKRNWYVHNVMPAKMQVLLLVICYNNYYYSQEKVFETHLVQDGKLSADKLVEIFEGVDYS